MKINNKQKIFSKKAFAIGGSFIAIALVVVFINSGDLDEDVRGTQGEQESNHPINPAPPKLDSEPQANISAPAGNDEQEEEENEEENEEQEEVEGGNNEEENNNTPPANNSVIINESNNNLGNNNNDDSLVFNPVAGTENNENNNTEEEEQQTQPDEPVENLGVVSGVGGDSNAHTITLWWDAVSDATLYDIAYCGGDIDCSGSMVPIRNVENTQYVLTELKPKTRYSFSIIAKNDTQVSSAWSSYYTVKTKSDITNKNRKVSNNSSDTKYNTPAITSVVLSDTNPMIASISYDVGSLAQQSGYSIDVRSCETSSGSCDGWSSIESFTPSGYTGTYSYNTGVNNAISGKTYSFQIRASGDLDDSDWTTASANAP